MLFKTEEGLGKTQPISYEQVERAYRKVRSNGGAGGVDGIEWEAFDKERRKHLYKLWNRMASGCYFPQAVRERKIPKADGKTRSLGIPTLLDRIAQQVVVNEIEGRMEAIFHENSYGYRAGKNAHQAVEQCKQRCWKKKWVVDLDIKGFFDNINHELLMKAVRKHVTERWILLYIERWLQAPVEQENGERRKTEKGTPQGGVIAPRTHPQTLSLLKVSELKEVDLKFDNFIKGIIFMKYGKITELGIGKTYQSGLCFTEERNSTFTSYNSFDGQVWSFQNTGIQIYSAGQRKQRESSYSGKFCGVYRQTPSQSYQESEEVGEFPGNVHQQSGQGSIGRVFIKEKLCPKKRGKLKCHSPTTVCGSKNSLRFTICLPQQMKLLSPVKIQLMN